MAIRFQNKVVIITGGNSGIGKACAMMFADEGAQVVIAARNAGRANETVAVIREQGGKAEFMSCDVRDHEQCQQVVEETVKQHGQLDILVNNAGIIHRNRDVSQTTLDEWHDTFDVNVNGTFYFSKYVLPHLIQSRGNIVNLASYIGLVGFLGAAAYCASKGAMVQLTRAMALDHAAQGVRVNCVCPGSVDTPMIHAAWDTYGEGAQERWEAKHPLGRIATPEEVAAAVLYLASSEAGFITGVALPIDGGIMAG
jgi:NAD(P)-dependent dehydrogenase (short-subunit alcohol dehydrogenase family)